MYQLRTLYLATNCILTMFLEGAAQDLSQIFNLADYRE